MTVNEVDDVIKSIDEAMARVEEKRREDEDEAAKKPKAKAPMDPERIEEIRTRRWLRKYMMWF